VFADPLGVPDPADGDHDPVGGGHVCLSDGDPEAPVAPGDVVGR
jgi:hypothetical protein